MNRLYYGDNLGILREHIADESVDLVYLDPPFNSNATYNVLFRSPEGKESPAQIEAFDDTWHWSEPAENAYWEVLHGANTEAARMLEAMRGFLGENDMMAYLAMMAVRLIELHRVLKKTGSLYLHCDPTASHYLKILLDAIFGKVRFETEIIWKRTFAHGNVTTGYGDVTDTILFYSKSNEKIWNQIYTSLSADELEKKYPKRDANGRRWQSVTLRNPGVRPNLHYPYTASNGVTYHPHPNGWSCNLERMRKYDQEGKLHYPSTPKGALRLKMYEDESLGERVQSLWDDIPPIGAQAQERLGYPTQKPVALLERIISASSNEGDVVLDPFCGCGTTVHAAQKLNRQWIGIDVTHLAIGLIERRLRDAFGKEAKFETIGVPQDIGAAKALADKDKHEFEKWAISLIPDAQPFRGGKKGADTGIDGIIYLKTGKSKTDKAIVEVKGGAVSVDQIHKLKSVIDREKALVGIFLTLHAPTKPMEKEAAAAGFAETDYGRIPRIQILTIDDILSFRKVPRLPVVDSSAFKKAKREEKSSQGKLDL
jgi:site-specific DNA-methyltransferase (adenine-specific)